MERVTGEYIFSVQLQVHVVREHAYVARERVHAKTMMVLILIIVTIVAIRIDSIHLLAGPREAAAPQCATRLPNLARVVCTVVL